MEKYVNKKIYEKRCQQFLKHMKLYLNSHITREK